MKTKTVYICQQCGQKSLKWLGRCPDCNAWNSLVEEVEQVTRRGKGVPAASTSRPLRLHEISATEVARIRTGIG